MDDIKQPLKKGFAGELSFLSNMLPCSGVYISIPTKSEGRVRYWFPTVENAYQFSKLPDGLQMHKAFVILYTGCNPYHAKVYGKNLPLRDDWTDEKKIQIMSSLIDLKFAKGSHLAGFLLRIKDEDLVEYNYWGDTFWGVCNGKGEDNLGKILRARKTVLQNDFTSPPELSKTADS